MEEWLRGRDENGEEIAVGEGSEGLVKRVKDNVDKRCVGI